MADRVLLTGKCDTRNRHVMFKVIETAGGRVIDAKFWCAGREWETWTPRRRELTAGRTTVRYGCQCRSALIGDDQIRDRIRRGDSEWLIAATNISRR